MSTSTVSPPSAAATPKPGGGATCARSCEHQRRVDLLFGVGEAALRGEDRGDLLSRARRESLQTGVLLRTRLQREQCDDRERGGYRHCRPGHCRANLCHDVHPSVVESEADRMCRERAGAEGDRESTRSRRMVTRRFSHIAVPDRRPSARKIDRPQFSAPCVETHERRRTHNARAVDLGGIEESSAVSTSMRLARGRRRVSDQLHMPGVAL